MTSLPSVPPKACPLALNISKTKMFDRPVAFSRLPTDEHDDTNVGAKVSPTARPRKLLYALACGTILLIVLLASVAIPSSRLKSSSTRWSSCGDSLETAQERGCSFDLISFAWQTPECYDTELVAEFSSWSNWTFYADDKFTIPVSQEIARQGNRTPLFVKWDYHIVHCTFMWRQMHRAYERGWIDSHLGNYNHTLHCQRMMLMDKSAAEKAITVARIIYPPCTEARRITP